MGKYVTTRYTCIHSSSPLMILQQRLFEGPKVWLLNPTEHILPTMPNSPVISACLSSEAQPARFLRGAKHRHYARCSAAYRADKALDVVVAATWFTLLPSCRSAQALLLAATACHKQSSLIAATSSSSPIL